VECGVRFGGRHTSLSPGAVLGKVFGSTTAPGAHPRLIPCSAESGECLGHRDACLCGGVLVHRGEPERFLERVSVDADDGQLFGNLDAKPSGGSENGESDFVRSRRICGGATLGFSQSAKRAALATGNATGVRQEIIEMGEHCVTVCLT